MKNHLSICLSLWCLTLTTSASPAVAVEAGFRSPPNSAKPYTWWHWMNGNVTKEGITKDLEAMKAVGLGGFQQFDINWGIPAGPVAFNSARYHELMSFAFAEASRLGLEAGFHNASGWSSSGGPWITPENSMKTLVWSEVSVSGGSPQAINLALPALSEERQKQTKLKNSGFYKDVAVLAFPSPQNKNYRIKSWREKALLTKQLTDQGDVLDEMPAPADAVIAAGQVFNLTNRMDAQGKLDWMPPAGDWTVLRFGFTTTGVMNHPGTKDGTGLEVDKLSRKATDVHWEAFINKVIANAKGLPSLTNILIDSYEVGMQNWTDDLAKEFQARRGYDLIPHLLCITGRVLDNTETTERVLWDLRTTACELMQENYFGYFAEKCHELGLKLAIEPYGNGNFDAATTALLADVPMSELGQGDTPAMWQWTAQVISSAAHLSGRSIIGAEMFTSMKGDWTDHPYRLKKGGDWAFSKGINRYYLHTFAHQPWNDSVKPGMMMGGFGGNFHRNNTWFPKSGAWMEYLARCQFIMQQGSFQADVLALYGDERAFHNFLRSKEFVDLERIPGLNYDLGGMRSLDNLAVDPNGDLRVTWKGKALNTSYKLLVLKHADLMLPENIAKLGALADKGAKIFAPQPRRSPSLENYPAADQKLQALIKRYWDTKLIRDPAEFTAAAGALVKDCEVPEDILFNRHRIAADDFYFISNQTNEAREITARFRAGGKLPEIWNPLTGEITEAANWKSLSDKRTEVSLSLPPVDSLFVVFRKATKSQGKLTPKTDLKEMLALNDQWTVAFDPSWGPKEPVPFDRLIPWNESARDEVKHFSGTATYRKIFDLPPSILPSQSPVFLDLGQVEVMAKVTLNGKDLGTLWKPPFRLEVSSAIKAGANTLEIEITNLWVNRLIGDERFPPFANGYPDWLVAGKPVPDDSPRKTFILKKHWKKTDPLFPSGLIGPVTLQAAASIPLK